MRDLSVESTMGWMYVPAAFAQRSSFRQNGRSK